ncbi:hypothetical protein BTUL_0041g00590 [Botrytis tulipae]|uniref:Uncharacterized protein n=1 Tax=Botrytis tulipae TaxID=87230 RepID=A0A4Z1ESM6_9HELO|nr:hypothetical protein BTUL_0041g00590 [Botrytis tulipae]
MSSFEKFIEVRILSQERRNIAGILKLALSGPKTPLEYPQTLKVSTTHAEILDRKLYPSAPASCPANTKAPEEKRMNKNA